MNFDPQLIAILDAINIFNRILILLSNAISWFRSFLSHHHHSVVLWRQVWSKATKIISHTYIYISKLHPLQQVLNKIRDNITELAEIKEKSLHWLQLFQWDAVNMLIFFFLYAFKFTCIKPEWLLHTQFPIQIDSHVMLAQSVVTVLTCQKPRGNKNVRFLILLSKPLRLFVSWQNTLFYTIFTTISTPSNCWVKVRYNVLRQPENCNKKRDAHWVLCLQEVNSESKKRSIYSMEKKKFQTPQTPLTTNEGQW